MKPHDAYGSFRAALLTRIFAGKPSPKQVGQYLASKMAKYPQITQSEVDRYLAWGDKWPEGQAVKLALAHGWEPTEDFRLQPPTAPPF